MSAGFPEVRPRRLRGTRALRAMVAETALRPAELVLPVFIKEGIADPQPISSMPGVLQHTRESLRKAAAEAATAGVGGIIVFGVPADKDSVGSGADDPDGIVQVAISEIRDQVGDDLVVMADLCLCEYTDHGTAASSPRRGRWITTRRSTATRPRPSPRRVPVPTWSRRAA